jgi:hypothetical protein
MVLKMANFNEYQCITSHNSYDKRYIPNRDDRPPLHEDTSWIEESIMYQLDKCVVRGLEFDVHARLITEKIDNKEEKKVEYLVYHYHRWNFSQKLDTWLNAVKIWAEKHYKENKEEKPEPIIIYLDIKRISKKKFKNKRICDEFPEYLDKLIWRYLPVYGKNYNIRESIFKPIDLVELKGKWPSLNDLRGKFIFVLSGGDKKDIYNRMNIKNNPRIRDMKKEYDQQKKLTLEKQVIYQELKKSATFPFQDKIGDLHFSDKIIQSQKDITSLNTHLITAQRLIKFYDEPEKIENVDDIQKTLQEIGDKEKCAFVDISPIKEHIKKKQKTIDNQIFINSPAITHEVDLPDERLDDYYKQGKIVRVWQANFSELLKEITEKGINLIGTDAISNSTYWKNVNPLNCKPKSGYQKKKISLSGYRVAFEKCAKASYYAYPDESIKSETKWMDYVKNGCDFLDGNTLKGFGKFDDSETVVQGYTGLSKKGTTLYIVFRGSDSMEDWLHNFSIRRIKLKRDNKYRTLFERGKKVKPYQNNPKIPDGVKVHYGIFHAYDREVIKTGILVDNVTKYVDNMQNQGEIPNIIVTGHSLGGALATFCAQDVAYSVNILYKGLKTRVMCVTFGSPRVGNWKFEKWYIGQTNIKQKKDWFHYEDIPNQLDLKVYRFANKNDAITRQPSCLTGWKHVGEKCYIRGPRIYPGLSAKDHEPVKYKEFDYSGGIIRTKDTRLGIASMFLFYGLIIGGLLTGLILSNIFRIISMVGAGLLLMGIAILSLYVKRKRKSKTKKNI